MASGQRELNQIQGTCSRLEQKLAALRTELKSEELRASQLLDDLGQRQRLLASSSSATASTRATLMSSALRHTATGAPLEPSATSTSTSSALLRSARVQLGARRPSAEAPSRVASASLARLQLGSSTRPALAAGATGTRSSFALRTTTGTLKGAGDALDGGSAVSEMLSQSEQQKHENEKLRAEIASLVERVSHLQQEVWLLPTFYARM